MISSSMNWGIMVINCYCSHTFLHAILRTVTWKLSLIVIFPMMIMTCLELFFNSCLTTTLSNSLHFESVLCFHTYCWMLHELWTWQLDCWLSNTSIFPLFWSAEISLFLFFSVMELTEANNSLPQGVVSTQQRKEVTASYIAHATGGQK